MNIRHGRGDELSRGEGEGRREREEERWEEEKGRGGEDWRKEGRGGGLLVRREQVDYCLSN